MTSALRPVVNALSKHFVRWLFAAGLAGCASHPADLILPSAYDPATHARIRIFAGTVSHLTKGDICDGRSHESIEADNGVFTALKSNRTIGMPRTAAMPSSKYNEYVIPADQLITVSMYWSAPNASGAWEHCGPTHILFTPAPGQDYEAWMRFERGVCQGVELHRLISRDAGIATGKPAVINRLPFHRCRPMRWYDW